MEFRSWLQGTVRHVSSNLRMVCLSTAPTSRSASIVSWIAASASLLDLWCFLQRVDGAQFGRLKRTGIARCDHQTVCGGRRGDIAVCLADGLALGPRPRHQVGIDRRASQSRFRGSNRSKIEAAEGLRPSALPLHSSRPSGLTRNRFGFWTSRVGSCPTGRGGRCGGRCP